eukprot:scaffold13338_cov284-Alexandrium_tamarense.AAC.2
MQTIRGMEKSSARTKQRRPRRWQHLDLTALHSLFYPWLLTTLSMLVETEAGIVRFLLDDAGRRVARARLQAGL